MSDKHKLAKSNPLFRSFCFEETKKAWDIAEKLRFEACTQRNQYLLDLALKLQKDICEMGGAIKDDFVVTTENRVIKIDDFNNGETWQ